MDLNDFIFELSKAPVLMLCADFTILKASAACLKLYNSRLEDVIGKPCHVLLGGNERYIKNVLLQNELLDSAGSMFINTIETETVVSDEKLYVRWDCHILRNNDQITYLMSGENITSIRILEQKLYELDNIIAQFPGTVYWYDQKFVFLGCNENAAKILGSSRKEVVGQDFRELMQRIIDIDKTTIDHFVDDGLAVIRTGKAKLNIEEKFINQDGEMSYWLANKMPLHNRHGDLYGVVGISTDVTYLKNIQNELIDAEMRSQKLENISTMSFYKKIIDNLPQFIFWKDRYSSFLGCNKNFAKLVGLNSAGEIFGKTDYDLPWSRAEADSYTRDDRLVIETKKPKLFYEETQKKSDGTEMTVLVSKVPLIVDGMVNGIICIYQDITERVRLEEKLIKSQKSEAEFKAMSTMGGMIAHELRTPLSGMQLGLMLIERYLPTLLETYRAAAPDDASISESAMASLQNVSRNLSHAVQRMDDTIDTVLSGFRSVEASPETLTAIPLAAFLRECIDRYPLTDEELALIHVGNVDLSVLGNTSVLSHVLINVLKNALFVIQEMGRGIILISAHEVQNVVHLSIKDTAKGVPAERLQEIFEPFYTTKNIATSIGMGLHFCKLALQKTGADIWCESIEGEYAEFIIRLPRVDNSLSMCHS